MTYVLEGKVKFIDKTQTFDSGFRKREIVITTDGDTKYPQHVKFDFLNDDVDVLDNFDIDDEVKIGFSVKGNEYNGKFYVSLKGFAIGNVNGDSPKPKQKEKVKEAPKKESAISNHNIDDLPF
jgi:single-strand DNA-binding protein